MQHIMSAIIELETSLFAPETRASPDKLNKLIANNFTEIGASGIKFDKKHVLKRLPSEDAPKITAIDFELRILAPKCVQLLYRAVMVKAGESEPNFSLRSSIWELNNNYWQMSYHQGTQCEPFEM
ncbi:nuclear transport factor 2 family protein [Endozoicomonadaceae bacterium StTr2]